MLNSVGYSSGDFESPDEFAEIVKEPNIHAKILVSNNGEQVYYIVYVNLRGRNK